jgi:hypothetical protein
MSKVVVASVAGALAVAAAYVALTAKQLVPKRRKRTTKLRQKTEEQVVVPTLETIPESPAEVDEKCAELLEKSATVPAPVVLESVKTEELVVPTEAIENSTILEPLLESEVSNSFFEFHGELLRFFYELPMDVFLPQLVDLQDSKTDPETVTVSEELPMKEETLEAAKELLHSEEEAQGEPQEQTSPSKRQFSVPKKIAPSLSKIVEMFEQNGSSSETSEVERSMSPLGVSTRDVAVLTDSAMVQEPVDEAAVSEAISEAKKSEPYESVSEVEEAIGEKAVFDLVSSALHSGIMESSGEPDGVEQEVEPSTQKDTTEMTENNHCELETVSEVTDTNEDTFAHTDSEGNTNIDELELDVVCDKKVVQETHVPEVSVPISKHVIEPLEEAVAPHVEDQPTSPVTKKRSISNLNTKAFEFVPQLNQAYYQPMYQEQVDSYPIYPGLES